MKLCYFCLLVKLCKLCAYLLRNGDQPSTPVNMDQRVEHTANSNHKQDGYRTDVDSNG